MTTVQYIHGGDVGDVYPPFYIVFESSPFLTAMLRAVHGDQRSALPRGDEKLLSLTEIYSFYLGRILWATCMTDDLDFCYMLLWSLKVLNLFRGKDATKTNEVVGGFPIDIGFAVPRLPTLETGLQFRSRFISCAEVSEPYSHMSVSVWKLCRCDAFLLAFLELASV